MHGRKGSRGQPKYVHSSCLSLLCMLPTVWAAQVILVNIRSFSKLSFPLRGLAGGISGGNAASFPRPQELCRMRLSKYAAVVCDSKVHTEEMSPWAQICLNLHAFAGIINSSDALLFILRPSREDKQICTSHSKRMTLTVAESIQRATSCGWFVNYSRHSVQPEVSVAIINVLWRLKAKINAI